MVICDEIIKETKSTSRKAIPTKSTSTNFYILIVSLLITIALLIAISIYLIKYRLKQKRLLPFHDPSKVKEININNIL